jgi:hypothetical protein
MMELKNVREVGVLSNRRCYMAYVKWRDFEGNEQCSLISWLSMGKVEKLTVGEVLRRVTEDPGVLSRIPTRAEVVLTILLDPHPDGIGTCVDIFVGHEPEPPRATLLRQKDSDILGLTFGEAARMAEEGHYGYSKW